LNAQLLHKVGILL